MPAEAPAVSFVIPVRDDARRLEVCLRSIARTKVPDRVVECVVADNGSTDASPDVARAAGAAVLVLPGLRVSSLRNRAAEAASADLLAFVDADHELAPAWTSAALDLFTDPSVGVAGAHYTPPPDGTWVQRMFGVLRGRTRGRHDAQWLGSGNLIVRRQVFAALAGFDERLVTCEDVDFCERARAAGVRVVADEGLMSVHHGDPRSLGELFLSERWRGRDNLKVSLRHVPDLRGLPSIVIPILQAAGLAVTVLAMVAAPWAGTPAIVAAAAALTVVVGLMLLRAARMVVGGRLTSPIDGLRAIAVAGAYDLGRAVSLLLPAGHRRARRGRVAAEAGRAG
ncbi:MAG: glycosyltransferase [Vicinamibacterales bacterium]